MTRPIRYACTALFAVVAAPAFAAEPALPRALPVRVDADRFFVAPVTADGTKLEYFTDTGGGLMLTVSGADKLEPKWVRPKSADDPPATVAWPELGADAWIPRPAALEDGMPVYVPQDGEPPLEFGDGMLGAPWFADRTWEFDYAKGTLRVLPAGALPDVDAKHRVKLGFQSEDGKHTTHFPRITVQVDGEPLELLFDTGATTTVRPEAMEKVGENRPATRGTSFIVRSVLRKWREKHPDWLVVEGAETPGKAAMIRVPEVEFAGHTVGPVWFTERLDPNFHEWMSQWMDKRIDGALGGNALRGLRVTVDYPSETATFEKP